VVTGQPHRLSVRKEKRWDEWVSVFTPVGGKQEEKDKGDSLQVYPYGHLWEVPAGASSVV